jgi:glycosyltransferase involved in cell wall biosynthesis
MYANHTAAVSGAERSLLALLAALPPDVEPLVASPRGRLSDEVERLGLATTPIADTAGSLRLHPLHTPRALAEMSAAALQVRRAAHRHRADVVHANSVRAGLELALARVAPAASIVHVRDCLPAGVLSTATMRTIAATATSIVANSQYTADTVKRAVPAARVEVVHPGIDLAEFDPARIDRAAAREALGVAGTRRVLLGVVAQLSPWKGQDTAIEALQLLREQDLDAHLLLIGEAKFVARSTRFDNDAYVSGLHRLVAQAGLEDRVSWLGERDDVPQLIRALDVLMLPSHEEPFGRALLEAMALEVPVLATSVGGPPELISEGIDGYLVPPREPAAWAQGVRRIVGGPAQGRALGRAGRLRIAEAFGAEDHAAAMLAVYESALARR